MLQWKVTNAPRSFSFDWPYHLDSVFQVFNVHANRKDISYVMFRDWKVWLNGEPQPAYGEPCPPEPLPYDYQLWQYLQTDVAPDYVYQEYIPESGADEAYNMTGNWYGPEYP